MPFSYFTPEETRYVLEHHVHMPYKAIDRALGRFPGATSAHLRSLRRRGLVPPDERRHKRPWTPEDERELRSLLLHYPVKEVARMLRRTFFAVQQHMAEKDLRANELRRKRGEYCAAEFADRLGVAPQTFRTWLDKGKIACRLIARGQPRWISEGEIHRILRETDWIAPQTIPDPKWRAVAERYVRLRDPDRHLTPKQVASRKGCSISTVKHAIERGLLKAERRTGYGMQWFIDPEGVDRWQVGADADGVIRRGGVNRKKTAQKVAA